MTKGCGHVFHKQCLRKALKYAPRCPICRKKMGAADFTDLKDIPAARFLHQSINELKVKCPLGCGAEMQWDLLKGHVRESCPKTLFYCKHGFCFETLNRDSIARHESICGEVIVKCECGKEIRRKDKEAHEQADRNRFQPWILTF